MDRLTAMSVFVDVASTGSFTASADRLNMSRPMVTRYVGEMEAWLQAKLFHRTTRSVSLTESGKRCLESCREMLGKAQHMQDELNQVEGELKGQLRLTASISFGYALLAEALIAFMAAHPKVTIDLDLSDGSVDLVKDRIDIAFRISNQPPDSLIARPLLSCRSYLIASSGYLEKHGYPEQLSDLKHHNCMGHSALGKHHWRIFESGELVQLEISPKLLTNETTVLLKAVLAGGGISILPTFLVEEYLNTGELIRVLPHCTVDAMTLNALYLSREYQPRLVRELLDFLVDRFK